MSCDFGPNGKLSVEGLKLCPFRKKTYAMASNSEHSFNTYLNKAEFFEEEFQPCLKENCAAYNTSYMSPFCGLRQK